MEKSPKQSLDVTVFSRGGMMVMAPLSGRARKFMIMEDGIMAVQVDHLSPIDVMGVFPDDFIIGNTPLDIPDSAVGVAELSGPLH